jgi:hypothetical protein
VLRGGKLDNINRVRFRLPWLVFLGLGLQIGIEVAGARYPSIQHGPVGPLVLAISYGCVAAFVALNYRYPGALLIGLGVALNLIVILANGAMPVSSWAAKVSGLHATSHLENSVKHTGMGPGTRLKFLGDIIPVPPLGIVSVGDVVLASGVFMLVSFLMAPPDSHGSRRKRRIKKPSGGNQTGGNPIVENQAEGGPGHHHRQPNAPEPPACSGSVG